MGALGAERIHDLDQERPSRRPEKMATVVGEFDPSLSARLDLAMDILGHNQSFITFIDKKANSLLLLNSIFLATAAAGGLASVWTLLSLGAASLAALTCLAVVWARLPSMRLGSSARFVFFSDILGRRNAATFTEDLRRVGLEDLFDSTARQVYELAQVEERKFSVYRWAQLATLASAALWLGRMLSPLLS